MDKLFYIYKQKIEDKMIIDKEESGAEEDELEDLEDDYAYYYGSDADEDDESDDDTGPTSLSFNTS